MKTNLITVLIVALTALSCNESDPCDKQLCSGHGTCIDGDCYCESGFEGSECTTEWSAKFVGTWKGKSNCLYSVDTVGGPPPISKVFTATVTRLGEKKIRVANFGGAAGSIDLDLTGTKTLAVFNEFNTTSSVLYTGKGTVDEALKITLIYSETNFVTGDKFECAGTLVK